MPVVLRIFRQTLIGAAASLLVILFNFATLGVFGLPIAITSSVLGIGFAMIVVVTASRRDGSREQ
jgi:hypothetical protein